MILDQYSKLKIGDRFRAACGGNNFLIDVEIASQNNLHPRRDIVEDDVIEYTGKFFDPIHGNDYHDNFLIIDGGFEGQFYPHIGGNAILREFMKIKGAKL